MQTVAHAFPPPPSRPSPNCCLPPLAFYLTQFFYSKFVYLAFICQFIARSFWLAGKKRDMAEKERHGGHGGRPTGARHCKDTGGQGGKHIATFFKKNVFIFKRFLKNSALLCSALVLLRFLAVRVRLTATSWAPEPRGNSAALTSVRARVCRTLRLIGHFRHLFRTLWTV